MSQNVFEIDIQTLHDLEIFPKYVGEHSVISIFINASTIGGTDKLNDIFKNPLTDANEIEARINAIKYLQDTDINFKANKRTCDYIEFYLSQPAKPTSISKIKAIEKKAMYFFTGDNDFYIICRGIKETLTLLLALDDLAKTPHQSNLPKLIQELYLIIHTCLEDEDFVFVRKLFFKKNLNALDIARADYLFRNQGYQRLKTLLDIVYQLDVFISVSEVSKIKGYSFPVVNKSGNRLLKLQGLFHPFLDNPVPNNVEFDYYQNICFVTGANMAGKSTFLKSVGIAVYLSQLGFPVPAANMETSVFEGIITTINLADNIHQGNSHFFTEVSRVKYVAKKLALSQNILIIFDELFRGTNVKDAFDASLAIISAFSKLRKSFFIVSTHIVEVANELLKIKNIKFSYMETSFNNEIPSYSYKLRDGITEERLGMWIVKNEGIVEIIEGIVNGESD